MRSYLRTSPGMTQNANVIGRNVARFRYQKGWSQDLLVTKMQIAGFYITRDILANTPTPCRHLNLTLGRQAGIC